MRRLRAVLGGGDREAGLTLVELLVAAAMSIVLVGAAGSMLISAVQSQPNLSKKAQNITTARYVMEKITREIRNGVVVYAVSGSEVSFETRVRRTTCGGAASEASAPAIECRVTYSCTATACTRTETAPEVETGGTPVNVVSGLSSGEVFDWSCDPEDPCEEPGEITYVGVRLDIPNPEGSQNLTITDGANLRTRSLEE